MTILQRGIAVGAFVFALSVAVPGIASENGAKKGYWVVESNTENAERYSIVRFYNTSDEMIHEEKVEGKTIKMTPRNIKKLNKVLESYITNRFVELALQ